MTGKAGWRVVQDSDISKRFYSIFAHHLTRDPHGGVLGSSSGILKNHGSCRFCSHISNF